MSATPRVNAVAPVDAFVTDSDRWAVDKTDYDCLLDIARQLETELATMTQCFENEKATSAHLETLVEVCSRQSTGSDEKAQLLEDLRDGVPDDPTMAKCRTATEAMRLAAELLSSSIPSCAVAPEGWKLVPVKPTLEMMGRGNGSMLDQVPIFQRTNMLSSAHVYSAMLDAAPPAPAARSATASQDAKDAARYRWLRHDSKDTKLESSKATIVEVYQGAAMDEKIDKAMGATPDSRREP